jgi:hypothetical protein
VQLAKRRRIPQARRLTSEFYCGGHLRRLGLLPVLTYLSTLRSGYTQTPQLARHSEFVHSVQFDSAPGGDARRIYLENLNDH